MKRDHITNAGLNLFVALLLCAFAYGVTFITFEGLISFAKWSFLFMAAANAFGFAYNVYKYFRP